MIGERTFESLFLKKQLSVCPFLTTCLCDIEITAVLVADPRLFLTVDIFLQNTEKVLPGCTVRCYLHSEQGLKHLGGGFCLCLLLVIQTS